MRPVKFKEYFQGKPTKGLFGGDREHQFKPGDVWKECPDDLAEWLEEHGKAEPLTVVEKVVEKTTKKKAE